MLQKQLQHFRQNGTTSILNRHGPKPGPLGGRTYVISMSKTLVEELKAFLEIDKHALDDEIVKQPSLFFRASEAYVEAAAERDACKEELATIDAELDGKIRHDLEVAGDKYTEAIVKNGIQAHKRHSAAFDTYILAKTRADQLLGLKEAFHQRSYMVRDLASLYVASYYENSSVQGNGRSDKVVYDRQRERLATAREASRLDARK